MNILESQRRAIKSEIGQVVSAAELPRQSAVREVCADA
jgi:hypothetical protein